LVAAVGLEPTTYGL